MNKFENFKEYVFKFQLGNILNKVSFKCLTSLKVGGRCELLYIPDDFESLCIAIDYLIKEEIPYFVIGSGTNILVNDRDFAFVVITLKNLKRYYLLNENDEDILIYVEAGVKLPIISNYAIKNNFCNAEFMSVIPGTIGGAIYMNAGAYHSSISDILQSITFIDENGKVQTLMNDDKNLKFGYRDSIFKQKHWIIISCVIKLKKYLQGLTPKMRVKNYLAKKRLTQPIDTNNAGSVFKNLNRPVWEIIDELGLRGYKINDAMISSKHANFIININEASFNDIYGLILMIKEQAKIKMNIELECEWEIIK